MYGKRGFAGSFFVLWKYLFFHVLKRYLQEAGHNTISAFDGDEAITLFSEHKIDLVVLDIMLPTVNLTVLKRSRESDINLRPAYEKIESFSENIPLYLEPDAAHCPAVPYADLFSDAAGI